MSLIVFKRSNTGSLFMADTRAWDDLSESSKVLDGFLKIIIINRNLCICWAGLKNLAEDAIDLISHDSVDKSDILEICSILQGISKSGEVDFFVSMIDNGHQTFKIDETGIRAAQDIDFIGDSDAFGKFRHEYRREYNQADNPDQSLLQINSDAFRSVITSNDRNIKTVGDFMISAQGRDFFTYLVSGFCITPEIKLGPKESKIISIESPYHHGYTISIFSSSRESRPACGLYIHPGNVGIFIDPEKPFSFKEKYYGVPGLFLAKVLDKHNVQLEGICAFEENGSLHIAEWGISNRSSGINFSLKGSTKEVSQSKLD